MKKLLNVLKIFLVILLINATPLFSQQNETIKELTERIKSSNQTIEKLIETIEEKNSIIDEKNSTIEDLEKGIKEKSKKIDSLEDEVSHLTERLKVSNNTIEELVVRIEKDQKEIERLRASLNDTSDYVQEHKYIIVGMNVSYPLGGGTLLGFNFDRFPIGIYSTINIDRNLYISTGVGISYRF